MFDGMLPYMYTISVGSDGAKAILEAQKDSGQRGFSIMQGSLGDGTTWHPLLHNMRSNEIPLANAVFQTIGQKLGEFGGDVEVTVEDAVHVEAFLTRLDEDPSLLVEQWTVGVTEQLLEALRRAGIDYEVMPPESLGPFGDLGKDGPGR